MAAEAEGAEEQRHLHSPPRSCQNRPYSWRVPRPPGAVALAMALPLGKTADSSGADVALPFTHQIQV
jgi:hypothetical protein